MEAYPATLQFNLFDQRTISAVEAGRALISWARAIEEASLLIDPSSPVEVDLIGTETACLRLHTILRFIDNQMTRAGNALTPYPEIKSFLALNVFVLPGMVIGGAVGAGLWEIAKPHLIHEPAAVQQAARQATRKLEGSPVIQNKVQDFYRSVEDARSVEAVKIYERNPEDPIALVPRSHFAERSGLWVVQDADEARRPREAIWDVVVTHPAIISKPRTWRFLRDGMPFKAKLADPYFLTAIKERTLPMQVAEGTLMRVRVEWFEVLRGDEWIADSRTFVISRVLWPAPLQTPVPAPLLSILENDAQEKHSGYNER